MELTTNLHFVLLAIVHEALLPFPGNALIVQCLDTVKFILSRLVFVIHCIPSMCFHLVF